MYRALFYVGTQRCLSVLRSVSSDQRGNVMLIVAAAIIPMLAILGGGIDMGRGYMAKTRLQQACDSGVLAARKKLGSTAIIGKVVPADATSVGNQFFKLNFQDFAYGTTEKPTFTMAMASDYSIEGTATANVPTTLMYIFGIKQLAVSADCSSQFNYSNTDVMMVLDVTGSMDSLLSGKAKIASLRQTVKDFYATVEGSKREGVRVRYGFVPYSTNVNVGYLLQSQWMANTGSYEGRAPNAKGTSWIYASTDVSIPSWKDSSGTALYKGGTAKVSKMGGSYSNATDLDVTFEGCIEERATYNITDYKNVDLTRALDLDIDLVPDPKDPDTQWKPWIREISWLRGSASAVESKSTYSKPTGDALVCPPKARKLAVMTASEVATYVDGLTPDGYTYHDIGMIWGGRMLSSTGIFAAENGDVNGRPTMRHMIFLTDGATQPAVNTYGAYGLEGLSQRRWSSSSKFTQTQVVENRFAFACDEVKNKNITVWVIGFGTTVTTLLKNCSGPGRWFQANDAAQLSTAFATIASAIGDLRIVK